MAMPDTRTYTCMVHDGMVILGFVVPDFRNYVFLLNGNGNNISAFTRCYGFPPNLLNTRKVETSLTSITICYNLLHWPLQPCGHTNTNK